MNSTIEDLMRDIERDVQKNVMQAQENGQPPTRELIIEQMKKYVYARVPIANIPPDFSIEIDEIHDDGTIDFSIYLVPPMEVSIESKEEEDTT